jgi:hypothetical protein
VNAVMLWLKTDLLSGWPVGRDAAQSTSVNRQQQEMIARSSDDGYYGLDPRSGGRCWRWWLLEVVGGGGGSTWRLCASAGSLAFAQTDVTLNSELTIHNLSQC